MPEQIQSIISNLRGFGVKRLAMLAGIAVLVMGVIGIASVYLNRPAYDTLYVGLDRSDVNQIGLVLGEAGIGFDVGSDGTSVLVRAGMTGKARLLLAERGLPNSANAGYELFDNVGSLGLTSFMQEVTRRACAGRRDRPHHPVDHRTEGGTRPHRAGRLLDRPDQPCAACWRAMPASTPRKVPSRSAISSPPPSPACRPTR